MIVITTSSSENPDQKKQKASKCPDKKLFRFNENKPHDTEDNILPNLLVYCSLSLMIKILLKIVHVEDIRAEIH